jgi:tetratricopeptide (TPR) repeat protein
MPADRHPQPRELRRFVAGGLAAVDNRRVVRHLLAGCEMCRSAAAEIWRPAAADSGPAVDRAVRAASECQAGIEAERAAAPGLLREIDEQPASRQLLLVLNSRRFRNWFLCEALLRRAYEAGFDQPDEAIRLAEIGVALAGRLVESRSGDASHHDLQARAWAVLGNARRVGSDHAGAEQAFGRARAALELGSGDPLEEANVEHHHGMLHHDRRRFAGAARCFDRAARLYRSVGDSHLVGKALADKACTLGESGDSERMIDLLRRAVPMLDPQRDARLVYVAQHNLTWALNESGRLDEALATLQQILPMHVRSAKATDRLRLRWLEGKLAQVQGELGRAEAAFREVCEGFLDRRVPYDAALASLDLAAVYYQQNRIGEMKRLAAETLPVFRTLGVHREALASLALFEQAVTRERISLRFIAELASYLQRARSNAKLAFQPPA